MSSSHGSLREEIFQNLLQCLERHVKIPPEELDQNRLKSEATGSMRLQDCSSHNFIDWIGAVLHWTWQDGSCCWNFLAQEGKSRHDDFAITLFNVQWTLDASVQGSNQLHAPTECRRFQVDPTPEVSPLQTFWKIDKLRLLCVECRDVTLFGTFSEESLRLEPAARFCCPTLQLHSPLPQTALEHVQLAKMVSLLHSYRTPDLIWHAPPVPHLESVSIATLGDVFRHVYNFLEDCQEEKPTVDGTSQQQDQQGPMKTLSSKINVKQSIGDSLAVTAATVATGASFVSPIGAAVSVAAVGVKDGVTAAAQKGKSTRNGETYQFGDVARGVVATIQERKRNKNQLDPSGLTPGGGENDLETSGDNNQSKDGNNYVQENKGRYGGLLGSSVGAAVGLTLVGGPIGLVAGSLLGSHATQEAIRRQSSSQLSESSSCRDSDEAMARQLNNGGGLTQQTRDAPSADEKKPFRLGDNIRGVVARGKQASGRDRTSAYRFGDFSRGLLKHGKPSPPGM